ncbi:DEAD/DEAH box helicase [Aspergillus clavatus NRRL 1]|uniref:DsDNA-dependent ATPase (Rad54b), putative n=1 Tax=Aspergillus clavatus (strain ATCC 1007 / CBS 513.65 / DSM 816 / NCTC 3887 / NRRL 1 / QM 1276 / 107) TaxID=344612 RepID=A1CNU6_ASPCL|nr:dsDNA-dependent ATPase (Rad54b), putative [Aspergillus clavatus NRRL 1]EAW07317.1 dsDNA-dependent ATPase (Rad54b), putative [Aspergillus clavatus NRRL 1]
MVFKPFKPPSIRKPPHLSSSDTNPEKAPSDRFEPPAKKQRLDTDNDPLSHSQGLTRKPLQQVTNPSRTSSDSAVGDELPGVKYYNVLWRKPTTKKNKTWDGDGILSARDGYLYLQDISGKDMGRAMMPGSRLEAGSMLSIGGKEVEVDSEIPRKEYLAGKSFLGKKEGASPLVTAAELPKKAFVPSLTNRSAVLGPTLPSEKTQSGKTCVPPLANPASRSSSITGAYKRPLLDGTVVPVMPASKPVPRHDPNQPGALVMKRPESVPKGKQIVDVVVDPILSKHLRPHQREGVQFLYECVMGMRSFNGEGAILADDMGLGKTLQTITLLWMLLKQNPIHDSAPVIKKALIVCPVTLINNWRKEFRKWLGNERIGVFVFDDKRKRLTDFTKGRAYSVMIVGYEKLRTVQEGLARGAGVDIVIADEGHRLKTLQNKSGQAIQALNATKRIILSGTPIQNDLKEFFAAVDLVNPGILGTFKAFVKEFEGPIVRSRQPEATRKEIEKGEARNEELRELTSKFMLRRTADILAKYLPPKSEYVLFCNPTSTQANIYRNVLASPVFQCAIGNSENALHLITILKKLCNSPSLLSPKNADETPSETIAALLSSLPPNLLRHFSPSSSAKIRVLDQLLHNLRTSTSEKIVLVSNYTSTLNLLANLLSSLSLPFLRLDGSTPAQKRQSLVEDFNRLPADLCFAFLLSAKAGGTGLNLIGASRLVLFDVDWNPATDIQAMARIHRDGQKRHCRIYRILLKGSLEEKIWQRQVTKIGLADSVMEHKSSVAQFSRDELRDLFRLDEESRCQTHELLGCDCGGTGRTVQSASSVPPTDAESKDPTSDPNLSSSSDLSDVEDDFPDTLTLIKASQVNMEEQERRIRAMRGTTRRAIRTTKIDDSDDDDDDEGEDPVKPKSKMQQSLSQYSHIDPALLASEEDGLGLAAAIDDDDVLLPLLRDEDNRIGFIFKKSGQAEAKGKRASSPVVLE